MFRPVDQEVMEALARERERRLESIKRKAEKVYARVQSLASKRVVSCLQEACTRALEQNDATQFVFLTMFNRIPVSIEEFLESTDFLGAVDMEVWPQIRADVVRVNQDIAMGADPVHEYIDSGATGTGKTMKAHITQAYQLYLVSCLSSPQRTYGLAAQTPIVFAMASSSSGTTRDVLFRPFSTMIQTVPYFRRFTRWNKDKTSVLEFDNGVQVEPVLATIEGIIGRAIICSHTDEANYMSVVDGSQRAHAGDGRRGVFDQAEIFVRAVKLRRRSRFSAQVPVPGMTILSSSTRYTDDFLDRRTDEVNKSEERGVVVFRHKQYEVQPGGRFSKKRFRLLVGTPEYSTRILEDHERPGEHYPENAQVEEIPENYRYDFLHRPEDALRDVCGISTVNLSPFITKRQKILEAVDRWEKGGNAHAVAIANVDLVEHGMPRIVPALLDIDQTTPRFIHIDLSKTKDRCGIAMLRVDRMVELPVEGGVFERLPHFIVELAVSIQPSQAAELDIGAVRNWATSLQSEHGIPIYMITYDGFNSAESIQMLRKIGIRSELVSMDRSDEAYQQVRRALYQDRLDMPRNEILIRELVQLDQDSKTGKIDHPKKGSKDISDAVAGAVISALTSRLYRNQLYFTDGKGNRVRPPGA